MTKKKNSPPAPAAAPDLSPAETIRSKLDEGFAVVQTGKMRSQMGGADAAASTRDFVAKTVASVREALKGAELTESQLAVVNKKIQALKDAADRI